MTVFTTQDFSDWNGGTGFYRPTAVQNAIQMGENKAVGWLNTGLVPTSFTDEIPWPSNWGGNKLMLDKVRLISIVSVTALWSCDTCDWTEVANQQCTFVHNSRHSIIRVTNPQGNWCSQGCPERLRITYMAGFTLAEGAAGTPIGTQLRAIVFNAALGYLITAIGLNADGNIFKPSYTAAGFSESRQGAERSGAEEEVNEFIQLAYELSRDLRVKRLPRLQ